MGSPEEDDPFGVSRKKAPAAHQIGESLDAMSVEELDDRLALLRSEITRLEQARDAREASRRAADAFFKS